MIVLERTAKAGQQKQRQGSHCKSRPTPNTTMSSQTAENYKNLGNKEYAAGNFSKAIEFYTDAVESDPKNHIYVTNRSAAYAAMKNWEKSLKDAETSIALKADWVKVMKRFCCHTLCHTTWSVG